MNGMGVRVAVVEELLDNCFEIDLAVSMMCADFRDEGAFFAYVLTDVIEHVYRTNTSDRPGTVIAMFNDILEFFQSGSDRGMYAEQGEDGVVYRNGAGQTLRFKFLCDRYDVHIS